MKTPEGVSEHDFRVVVSICYLSHMKYGKIVGPEGLADLQMIVGDGPRSKWVKYFREVLLTPEFAEAMKDRGIPWEGDPRGFDAKMHYALQVILQPLGRDTLAQRLKKAGITQAEYKAYMANPEFARLVKELSEKIIGDSQHLAHEALIKGLEKADLNAVRYYNELTGRYNPAREQVLEVSAVLRQVIEIIQRNVKDPVALQQIAAEMQALASGQQLVGEVINGAQLYNEIGA